MKKPTHLRLLPGADAPDDSAKSLASVIRQGQDTMGVSQVAGLGQALAGFKGLPLHDLTIAAGIQRQVDELSGAYKSAAALSGLGGSLAKTIGLLDSDSLAKTIGLVGGDSLAKMAGLEDTIGAWRSQLALPEIVAPAVAGEMARMVSEAKLATQSPWIEALRALDVSPAKKFAEAQSEYFAGIQSHVAALLRPTALLAADRLAERLRDADEEERLNLEALRKLGWWLPWSLPADVFLEMGRLARAGKRLRLRQAMNELSRSRDFRQIALEEWLAYPAFHERRHFLDRALRAHRKGDYPVSIMLLLPHLEGIPFAAFAPGSKATDPTHAIKLAGLDFDGLVSDGLLDAITVLYAYVPGFVPTEPARNPLNRHLILHGRTVHFASEVNSTKLLFAFDLLAEVLRQAANDTERKEAS